MGRIHSDALRFCDITAVFSYFRQQSFGIFGCFFTFLLCKHHYDYHTTEKFVRIEKRMKKNGM